MKPIDEDFAKRHLEEYKASGEDELIPNTAVMSLDTFAVRKVQKKWKKQYIALYKDSEKGGFLMYKDRNVSVLFNGGISLKNSNVYVPTGQRRDHCLLIEPSPNAPGVKNFPVEEVIISFDTRYERDLWRDTIEKLR